MSENSIVIREAYQLYFREESYNEEAREIIFKALQHIDDCQSTSLPITASGIALAIGINRDELILRSKEDTDKGKVYKKLLSICEKYAESKLLQSNQIAGASFVLKNLGGSWKDKSETELSGDLNLTLLLKAIRENEK